MLLMLTVTFALCHTSTAFRLSQAGATTSKTHPSPAPPLKAKPTKVPPPRSQAVPKPLLKGGSTCKRHADCDSNLCIHMSSTMEDAYSFSSASGICAYCAADSDCPQGQSCWAAKQAPSSGSAKDAVVPSCSSSPFRPEKGDRCWCTSQGPTGSPLAQARSCPGGYYCLVGDVSGSAVAMSLLYAGELQKYNRAPVQQCVKASSQGDVCAMMLGRWVAQPGACTGPQGQKALCENVGLINEDSDSSEQSMCTHACSTDAECMQGLQQQPGDTTSSSGGSSSLGMCDTDKVFHNTGSFCILTSTSQADGKVHVPGVACSISTACGPVGESQQLQQACVAHPKLASKVASKPAGGGGSNSGEAKRGPRYGICAAVCSKVGERCRKADAAAVSGSGDDMAIMYGPFYPMGPESFTVCVEQQAVAGGGKVLACMPPKGT